MPPPDPDAWKRFNWSVPQPCSPEPRAGQSRAAPPSLTGSQLAGLFHRDLGGEPLRDIQRER